MKACLCLLILAFGYFSEASRIQIPKTAIIGGGIGGTSAAYFLNELFGESDNIDLYEANDIGGRLATVRIGNGEFEVGGSIIHPRNKYMTDFAEIFGLKKRSHNDVKLGIYDGEFQFIESSLSLITIMKMIWHYGFSLFSLKSDIDKFISYFERIYDLQRNHEAFKDVKDLLYAMDEEFPKLMNISTYEGFISDGLSVSLINELIQASIRCNYGQSTSIHKFVGAVSVAGAGSDLWSVEGGNKKIPEKLIEASGANLFHEKVEKIKSTKSDQYVIYSDKANRTYDVVIFATPITNDHEKIKFQDFEVDIKIPGKYHHTVCTIVLGKINSTFFGFKKSEDVPNCIITTNESLFFNALSEIFPTKKHPLRTEEGKEKNSTVWKIFSQKILSNEELSSLFIEYKVVYLKDWLAYPEYTMGNREDTFVLQKNLFYVNAVEWAASAMEMSAVGSKNVALLIYNDWVKNAQQNLNPLQQKFNKEHIEL